MKYESVQNDCADNAYLCSVKRGNGLNAPTPKDAGHKKQSAQTDCTDLL